MLDALKILSKKDIMDLVLSLISWIAQTANKEWMLHNALNFKKKSLSKKPLRK
jgi:hypothetical protein